ncbi:MAG: TIGR00266 family protein, partial [Chloroflexota bacterium]
MDVEILYKPSYSMGVIKLSGGEQVRVEGGAMVSMSAGVTLETKATGGLLKSLARSVLGGESFFQNTYIAPSGGGEVSVAPALPGDMFSLVLKNEALMVQSGSYVASEAGVELNTKWGGAKTFFASEGLIMLRASGNGELLLSSYGAIHERYLSQGEKFTV